MLFKVLNKKGQCAGNTIYVLNLEVQYDAGIKQIPVRPSSRAGKRSEIDKCRPWQSYSPFVGVSWIQGYFTEHFKCNGGHATSAGGREAHFVVLTDSLRKNSINPIIQILNCSENQKRVIAFFVQSIFLSISLSSILFIANHILFLFFVWLKSFMRPPYSKMPFPPQLQFHARRVFLCKGLHWTNLIWRALVRGSISSLLSGISRYILWVFLVTCFNSNVHVKKSSTLNFYFVRCRFSH